MYITYLTGHLNSSCTNSSFAVDFWQQLCWESTAQVCSLPGSEQSTALEHHPAMPGLLSWGGAEILSSQHLQ